MDIVDFFDPYDKEHIEAYVVLRKTGMWPEGFILEGISFNPFWNYGIAMKMADAWVDLYY